MVAMDVDAARDLRTSLLDVVLRRITEVTRERKLAPTAINS